MNIYIICLKINVYSCVCVYRKDEKWCNDDNNFIHMQIEKKISIFSSLYNK